MINEYGDRVRFRVEDLGASPRAAEFGVDKYPAIFVDDALIARPEDFYGWGGPETGKYVPWTEVSNRSRFQEDLRRLIDYRLSGGEVVSVPAMQDDSGEPRLPDVTMSDLGGSSFRLASLKGKPVLIEFWATWCPPCLNTMSWMKELDTDQVHLVAIAVESGREQVDEVVRKFQPPGKIVMGDPGLIGSFGGVQAVPTMILADSDGKIIRVFYGAPPDLHDQIEKELATLLVKHET